MPDLIQTVPKSHRFEHYRPITGYGSYRVEKGDPLWWAVLMKYRSLDGQGLSPQALVYLTGQPWSEMREEIDSLLGVKPTLYVTYCGTVKSYVIKHIQGSDYTVHYTAHKGEQWKRATQALNEWVERFPPEKYRGVRNATGQIKLTVNAGAPRPVAQLKEYVKYVRGL